MKVLLTKFDDFLEAVSASQIFKKVYFQVENSVQPLETTDAEGNRIPLEAETEGGKKEQVHKVVSLFRATTCGWDPEKQKEDWAGCNTMLVNETVVGDAHIKEIGAKIDTERNHLIKRMKDKLVGNGVILTEGIVLLESAK